VGVGLALSSSASRRPARGVGRLSANLCVSLLSVLAIVALLEVFFRVIGFDFAREEENWRKTPPFFRQPTVPTGEVFFRRPGPEQWTGAVLNTRLLQLHLFPNPYADEPIITVEYDKSGFRNETGLTDWAIAVAGDSFTELGYLPHDQLFTTILARLMGVRVANLGVSYTGPLTQLSYLRDYGVTPGTRKTIIAFFEGNDLDDLAEESAGVANQRRTRQRPYREFEKRTSLVQAVYQRAQSAIHKQPVAPVPLANAFFLSAQGKIPITLMYTPPGRGEIRPETMTQLDDFVTAYAAFGKERGIEVWLAYMPSKERVAYGEVEFVADAPEKLKRWSPTDLPQVVAALADRHGVRFMDLTPALTEDTARRRELLFNSIYDTHLNARGSLIVAQEIARHLSADPSASSGGVPGPNLASDESGTTRRAWPGS